MKIVINAIIKNLEENKFLIIKRKSSDSIHPNKWCFPGGKSESKEDIFTTLKREIKEETNLDLKDNFKQISEYEYERPNKEITFGLCFSCTSLNENIRLNEEIEDFKWITKEELSKYNHIEGLEKEVEKAFNQ
tara:strand:- start:4637 stop:5035 length:399 start_codon:yes stop_codon:yes gene_type:complete